MQIDTAQPFQVKITYRNAFGDTATTIGLFDSVENMTEVLRICPGDQLLGIEFIGNK